MPDKALVIRGIENRVSAFVTLVEGCESLDIAGHFMPGDTIPLGGINDENMNSMPCIDECWKIVNHNLKSAVLVTVKSIIETPDHQLPATIEALKSGITIRLLGVTRIVGYYSRVVNWNSSKTAELADRRKGNYWESGRVNTGRVALVGE